MNFVRRNAAHATAAQLRENAEPIRAEIARLEAVVREAPGALADAAADPEAFAHIQAEFREAQALLPVKAAALAAIENAIPNAEKREAVEALRGRIADRERRTQKRMRSLEREYRAAAQAFADVLKAMDEEQREWDQLGREAEALGIPDRQHGAETRLRREFTNIGTIATGSYSLHRHALVVGWDGGTLFRGIAHEYPTR